MECVYVKRVPLILIGLVLCVCCVSSNTSNATNITTGLPNTNITTGLPTTTITTGLPTTNITTGLPNTTITTGLSTKSTVPTTRTLVINTTVSNTTSVAPPTNVSTTQSVNNTTTPSVGTTTQSAIPSSLNTSISTVDVVNNATLSSNGTMSSVVITGDATSTIPQPVPSDQNITSMTSTALPTPSINSTTPSLTPTTTSANSTRGLATTTTLPNTTSAVSSTTGTTIITPVTAAISPTPLPSTETSTERSTSTLSTSTVLSTTSTATPTNTTARTTTPVQTTVTSSTSGMDTDRRVDACEDSAFGKTGLVAFIILGIVCIILLLVLVYTLCKLTQRKKARSQLPEEEQAIPKLRMLEIRDTPVKTYNKSAAVGVEDGLQTFSLDYEKYVQQKKEEHKRKVANTSSVDTSDGPGVSSFLIGKKPLLMQKSSDSSAGSPRSPTSPTSPKGQLGEQNPLLGDDEPVVFNFTKTPGESLAARRASKPEVAERRNSGSSAKSTKGLELAPDNFTLEL